MSSIRIDGHEATFQAFGSDGGAAHFYGANGFPTGAYLPLIEGLSRSFSIESLDMRPCWPDAPAPLKSRGWMQYTDDLIAFLDARSRGPIVGIGHSMGASTTIFAAAKRPDLFKALVLIEPAGVERHMAMAAKCLPYAVRQRFMQPGKSTLGRRDTWDSRAEFRQHITRWKPLSRFSDEALDVFADHVIRPAEPNLTLTFPKLWEAHSYFSPASVWPLLGAVKCPVIAIHGEPSVFFSQKMWADWARRRPQDRIIKVDGFGHLLPMEAPERCIEIIADPSHNLHG